ncbi:MAG: hypothetical protein K8I02_07415 [Candidatus Methylomirabilis sp.]|nr:hypothetical protein [Deltaproteobacteria bacterium]
MASKRFPCPYLGRDVEFGEERAGHIAESHPDLLPEHLSRVEETLAAPDEVRLSARSPRARLFSRRYDSLGGRHVVVVVMGDAPPSTRRWIVTAYFARRLAPGAVEWKRN